MVASSLFLRSTATLVSAYSLFFSHTYAASSTSSSSYSLQTSYSGSTFFTGFNFYSDADPTHGFVTYVNQSTAQSSGLISATDGNPVYIGVDYTNTYNGNAAYSGINGVGRPSVRLESKVNFNHGLFVFDVANMPGGVCGTWPALWTLGDGTWPYNGEIDIVEGVNTQTQTLTSLHTAGKCIAPNSTAQSLETGTLQASNCTYDVNTGANSAGCGVLDQDTKSFGTPFNGIKGGVFAMEWTSTAIKSWFFERSSIPSDITAGTPNPAGWGNPYVYFMGDCNIDANFLNHRIVIDNTFCGDWAGAVWSDTCQSSTGQSSCSVYVGSNPSAFKNAYWSINSIKVYQSSSSSSTSSTSSTITTTSSKISTTTTLSTTSSTSTTLSTITTSSTTSKTSTTPTSTTSTTTSTLTTSPTTSTTKSSTTSTTSTPTSTTTSSSKSSTTSTTTTTTKTTTTTTTTKSTTTTTTTTTCRRGSGGCRRDADGDIEVDEHGYRPEKVKRGPWKHVHGHEHLHQHLHQD